MIIYGFPRVDLDTDLDIAARLGASVLEVLPQWRSLPDPKFLRARLDAAGFTLHSAHGCWGSRTIRADRVDLASPDPGLQRSGLDDILACLDWLAAAGGVHLVVHPGVLSDRQDRPARREALLGSLRELGRHAADLGLIVCVENMPPGVEPGSRMRDLTAIVAELDHPAVRLALDTGHAHIAAEVATETADAGPLLATTHVHDNNGRQDLHAPPGLGSIDWSAWRASLDAIHYRGPIMLECIRHLRERPESLDDRLLETLAALTN